MILDWTKHCQSIEERDQYVASLQRAKWVLDDLKSLVESNLASQDAVEISPRSYDSPNWGYRQAHLNGYKQALRDLNKLINIDPKE